MSGDEKEDKTRDMVAKVREWMLATKEARRLAAVRDRAKDAHAATVAQVQGMVDGLVEALKDEKDEKGVTRRHRIFIPAGENNDATIVEVTTGVLPSLVEAFKADFVGEGG